jgi:hypothetical protein
VTVFTLAVMSMAAAISLCPVEPRARQILPGG